LAGIRNNTERSGKERNGSEELGAHLKPRRGSTGEVEECNQTKEKSVGEIGGITGIFAKFETALFL
jgi:hypothetical protein